MKQIRLPVYTAIVILRCSRMIANIISWCSLQVNRYHRTTIARYSYNRTRCDCKSMLQSLFFIDDERQHEVDVHHRPSIRYECHTMFVAEHWVASITMAIVSRIRAWFLTRIVYNEMANDVKMLTTSDIIRYFICESCCVGHDKCQTNHLEVDRKIWLF